MAADEFLVGTSQGSLVRFRPIGDSLARLEAGRGLTPIRSLWVAPKNPRAVITTTESGLHWSADGGENFTSTIKGPALHLPNADLFDLGNGVLLVSGPGGVFEVNEQITQFGLLTEGAKKLWEWYTDKPLVGQIVAVILMVLAGILVALPIALWGGRIRFDLWWGKPVGFLVRHLPQLARPIIFARYRRRVKKAFQAAGASYYPLPAEAPGRTKIPTTGDALLVAVANASQPKNPVWLIGPGGAGKSTVLQSLVAAVAAGEPALKVWSRYRPILVTAEDYDRSGNLIAAITNAVERHHPAGLTPEVTSALLTSGRFLILFDGISEIDLQDVKVYQDILGTAKHQDFASCRFVFTSRSSPTGHGDTVIRLELLTASYVRSRILPWATSSHDQMAAALAQLDHLGPEPLAPLLVQMVIKAANTSGLRRPDSDLYRRLFAQLLKIDNNVNQWDGWAYILGQLAAESLLKTGNRAKIIGHIPAVNFLDSLKHGQKEVLAKLDEIYGIRKIAGSREALEHLGKANILQRTDTGWHFQHTRYEEYCAAVYLVDFVRTSRMWPPVDQWLGSVEKQEQFAKVLQFATELDDERALLEHMPPEHPQIWRSALLVEQ